MNLNVRIGLLAIRKLPILRLYPLVVTNVEMREFLGLRSVEISGISLIWVIFGLILEVLYNNDEVLKVRNYNYMVFTKKKWC
jgi:hypothetical protein